MICSEIKKRKEELLNKPYLGAVAYKVLNSIEIQEQYNLSGLDKYALLGFINKKIDNEDYISNMVELKGIKKLSLYTVIGLSFSQKIRKLLHGYFNNYDIVSQFFITEFFPEFRDKLKISLEEGVQLDTLVKYAIGIQDEIKFDSIIDLISSSMQIEEIYLIEKILNKLFNPKFNIEATLDKIFSEENIREALKKIVHNRRDKRPSFELKKETDIQDIVYTILKPYFPTLTDEVPTSKYIQGYTKVDFEIEGEGVFIEIKYLYEKTNPTKIREQLNDDIINYINSTENRVKYLYFLIYDPYSKIADSVKFKRDLENVNKEIKIKCFIWNFNFNNI